MHEAAARSQHAHGFTGGIVQAVASVERAVGNDEVVFVTEQRKVLQPEIRIVEDQELGPDQAKSARQPQ